MCLRVSKAVSSQQKEGSAAGDTSASRRRRRRRTGRRSWRPNRAPESWGEGVSMVAWTVKFVWSETLGKWPLPDLLLGVRYLSRRQDHLQVSSVFTGRNCVQIKGPDIGSELLHLLRLLSLCSHFTEKRFPEFLESSGYAKEDVLFQKPKAAFMKPSFTILCDKSTKCILLLIRGARSFKDRLTAATAAVAPFHHLILREGRVNNIIVGYAHCGMVAAAHWIAECTTPCLLQAISQYPDFDIKIIGHSLGGGIAALLTYMLREHEEFSSSSCIAFGPAACMTWDLADSSKCFVTSIVNNTDVVPSLSTISVDNLRVEVAASSWSKDCCSEGCFTRLFAHIRRFASVFGSCIPFIASKRAEDDVINADVHLDANNAQAAVKHENHLPDTCIRTQSPLSYSSCIGSQRVCDAFSDNDCVLSYHSPAPEDNSKTAVDEQEFGDSRDSVKRAREEQENAIVHTASEDDNQGNLPEALEGEQLYPPGKMLHMVGKPSVDANNQGENTADGDYVGIYETQRRLYGKVRLSKNMINDHYMHSYIRTAKQLIQRLEMDVVSCPNLIV